MMGATVLFCAVTGVPADIQFRIALAGMAILSAAIAYALHELQKSFVFVDYVHAEIE